jgi:hypothetical protein
MPLLSSLQMVDAEPLPRRFAGVSARSLPYPKSGCSSLSRIAAQSFMPMIDILAREPHTARDYRAFTL